MTGHPESPEHLQEPVQQTNDAESLQRSLTGSAYQALVTTAEVAGPFVGPAIAVYAQHKLENRQPEPEQKEIVLPPGVEKD
jgi:hypothetical protein